MDRDKTGPRLKNVYGRAAASVSTFNYSDALKIAHITWNAKLLDLWLTEPDERQDIIAYLKKASAK